MLCAEIDELVASHKVLTAPAQSTASVARQHTVVNEVRTPRQVSLTVRLGGPLLDPAWQVDDIGLEEIVLAYLGGQRPAPLEMVGVGGGEGR